MCFYWASTVEVVYSQNKTEEKCSLLCRCVFQNSWPNKTQRGKINIDRKKGAQKGRCGEKRQQKMSFCLIIFIPYRNSGIFTIVFIVIVAWWLCFKSITPVFSFTTYNSCVLHFIINHFWWKVLSEGSVQFFKNSFLFQFCLQSLKKLSCSFR